MIRALIFDCFGVFYVDASVGFYEMYVKNYHELRQQLMDFDKQYDYGYIDNIAHARLVAELSGLDFEFVRTNVRGKGVINQPLLDYSQQLRASYKIGMLSNIGKGGMEPFFSESDRKRYFDAVLLSSDVGVIKPNQEIFVMMAEKLGVEAAACIMIDDRQDNVDGARTAGMEGVLFETTEQCRRDVAEILERHSA